MGRRGGGLSLLYDALGWDGEKSQRPTPVSAIDITQYNQSRQKNILEHLNSLPFKSNIQSLFKLLNLIILQSRNYMSSIMQ